VVKSQTETVELDAELAQRATREAEGKGITLRQFVAEALERELTSGSPQPPFSMIGAFSSGRGDLSKLASEDVFEPEPFR
jgi:hypothetical protein